MLAFAPTANSAIVDRAPVNVGCDGRRTRQLARRQTMMAIDEHELTAEFKDVDSGHRDQNFQFFDDLA